MFPELNELVRLTDEQLSRLPRIEVVGNFLEVAAHLVLLLVDALEQQRPAVQVDIEQRDLPMAWGDFRALHRERAAFVPGRLAADIGEGIGPHVADLDHVVEPVGVGRLHDHRLLAQIEMLVR